MTAPPACLSIAGLPVVLHGLREDLRPAFSRHFEAFLAHDQAIRSPPRVDLTLTWGPLALEPGPDAEPHISFLRAPNGQDTRFTLVRVVSGHTRGEVDLAAGGAALHLASAHPLSELEYFLRVVYALRAYQAGGLMLHAAGVARGGRAFVFFGHSGSGKTTVARLSPDALVLNDDLVLLMPDGPGWTVHGTPFWNPTQVRPTAAAAPLAMLLRLVQSTTVYLAPMPFGQALGEMVSSAPVLPADPALCTGVLARCQAILAAVPAHRLHFLPDDSFWGVLGW